MSSLRLPHSVEPARRNLGRLALVRASALTILAAVVVAAEPLFQIPLPYRPLGAVLACLAIGVGATALRLRWQRPVDNVELLGQLIFDVGALTAVLAFTGGWANPFVSLYVLPLVFAATLLPGRLVWVMVGLTIAAYSALGLLYGAGADAHHAHGEFQSHLFGMWLSFVLAAATIAWVVTRMRESIRERDAELADVRERALRDQHVLALGALAAGTAHQLGTPLATIAVVVRELERAHPDQPDLLAELHTVREQIDRCKALVSGMTQAAGSRRAEGGPGLPVDEYLGRALENWHALRPGVDVRLSLTGTRPAPRIVSEATLGQTLVSLLDNAADASPECIELEGRWTPELLTVEIRDRGPGVAPGVAAHAGRRPVTTKAQGHGIGLMIAAAAIERFGGKVRLEDRDGGGACTRVEVPLAALAA
jgi:two-component system sensor histidine kinase RegB